MKALIETMARAMWERPVAYGRRRIPWDALDAEDQDVFRAYARAALAALETTDYRIVPVCVTSKMLRAGREAENHPLFIYEAMLAAAPKVTE